MPNAFDTTDAAAAAQPGRKLAFSGRAGELFPIWITNLLFIILTLGIFRFWARTRVRRYFWSRMRYQDEPFEYTGTGLELLIGFLIIFVVVLLPLAAISFTASLLAERGDIAAATALNLIFAPLILFLFGAGYYRARRYRMTRTLWRGIRGTQDEKGWRYGGYFLLALLANVFTLFLVKPITDVRLYGYEFNRKWLGSGRFSFDGRARPLYPTYLVCWLLAAPTLTLSLLWYNVAFYRHIARHTRYEDLSFAFETTPGRLFVFGLVNVLIIVFTLGLGGDFVQMRILRFISENLEIQGTQDFTAIAQTTAEVPGYGEGLADAFDIGGL